jgi:hypothetical protein
MIAASNPQVVIVALAEEPLRSEVPWTRVHWCGQAPHERVAVLLIWLGAQRRMELPAADVVAANAR